MDTVAITYRPRDVDPSKVVRTVRDGQMLREYVAPTPLPVGAILTGTRAYPRVEVNVPRALCRSNVEPAQWEEALAVLRQAFAEASAFAPACEPFERARLVRVDAVRDFQCGQGWEEHGRELALTAGAPRARVTAESDRDRNDAWTLRVGNREWSATLYDKHRQSGRPEAHGRVRYELRLHKRWLVRNGITLIGPEPAGLERLRCERFASVGFARAVLAPPDALSRILELPLSPSDQSHLWAHVIAERFRVQFPFSAKTARKYRELARTYSLGGSPLVAVSRRLDYERGELVAA